MSTKSKNPVMVKAGKKAAATRKKNAELKVVQKVERYVSKLSPVKRSIGEALLSGKTPNSIIKGMSKGRKTTANAQAYVTMVINGIGKIINK